MAARRAPATPLAAFLLHRYDWSESSLIVELFTRERGRVVAAAKGAKRPTSQLRPVLLPLQPIVVTLGREPADAEREIQTLRSAEWGGGPPMPAGDALMQGLYVNELVLKLLPRHDPHPALFDAYASTVARLGDAAAAAAALRAFELVLLHELGWLPELDRVTATAGPLVAGTAYRLDPEQGLAQVRGGPGDGEGPCGSAWCALAAGLAQRDFGALQHACAAVAQPLRAQTRSLLDYHLGNAPLRTRAVMQDLQRWRGPGSPPTR